MPGPYSITFNNYSGVSLNQCSDLTNWFTNPGVSSLSKTPEDPLPNDAVTVIEMSNSIIGFVSHGDVWIACGWSYKSMDFGVKIYVPIQVADMGDRPYYEVAYGDPSSPNFTNYMNPVGSPSDNYTFPSSVGFDIQVTPDSSHTSLTLSVNIGAASS